MRDTISRKEKVGMYLFFFFVFFFVSHLMEMTAPCTTVAVLSRLL